MMMNRDPRGEVCWGTGATYGGRAHVVLMSGATGLCGQPVDTRYRDRPTARPVCPDCAIAYVAAVFPTEATAPDLRHEVRLRA
ncbi:hypothetical protein LV75_000770 [Actinokineospora diospyrosa]|uniref:Zinc finger protein n=2 Tax=Actinokineospora diospyrosa TaxID=103728 RepID=A0ABT1I6P3_9PSEU|nr:hypothetical protein [Actinokineospora diospyrosa]